MAPASTSDFEANTVELKQQRASRRAGSLSKDRSEYKKQSQASSKTGRKGSVALVGSDPTNPHSAAHAATDTCSAKGASSGSSNNPQISKGRASSKGARRARKPSVGKIGDEEPSIEELEYDEYLIAAAVSKMQQRRNAAEAGDAPAVSLPLRPFQADLGDENAFPAFALIETKPAPQILHGAWALEAETDTKSTELTPEKFTGGSWLGHSRELAAEMTPEKFPKNIAEEATGEGDCMESKHNEELSPQNCPSSTAQRQGVAEELPEDWVVVASDDASKAAASLSQVGMTSFDGQHPRNVFGKKTASKGAMSGANSQETSAGVDWSSAGIPTDLLRRLIRGSVDAAHGVQAQNKAAPTPSHIMHAQNVGSSKRERSTPTTPRSHSKPRAMRQTSRGR